jgi:adenine phosphoribosyltransferase
MPNKTYQISINKDLQIDLPLVEFENGFKIYAFDLMGETYWNEEAAKSLAKKIKEQGYQFDFFITAEAKAIALAQELSRQFNHKRYVVLRKSKKLYMKNPVELEVKSITTEKVQHFYLGEEKYDFLKGKTVCIADDVVSTGGTINAFMTMAERIGFKVVAIACVLTEGKEQSNYKGIPIISLDHIPLP